MKQWPSLCKFMGDWNNKQAPNYKIYFRLTGYSRLLHIVLDISARYPEAIFSGKTCPATWKKFKHSSSLKKKQTSLKREASNKFCWTRGLLSSLQGSVWLFSTFAGQILLLKMASRNVYNYFQQSATAGHKSLHNKLSTVTQISLLTEYCTFYWLSVCMPELCSAEHKDFLLQVHTWMWMLY